MPHTSMPPISDTSRVNDVFVNNFICPSISLPSQEADGNSLLVPYNHDEKHIPHPVHSPTPQRGYLLPYAYGPQGSRSSQDIGTLTTEDCHSDVINVSRQCSARLSSSSTISLPLSQHGLVRISSRPNSCASPPMKVSRTPTPASVGIPPPGYSPPSSTPPLRVVLPMSTASVQRWNRNITVPTDVTYCLVDPLKFKFDDGDLPSGWISYTHPEGARYFFHKEKRIYTDANLYDPEEVLVITESANQILGDLENKTIDENDTLPTDVELVLEILPRETEKICGYYFVEHSSRCLFWLEEFDAEQICDEISVVVSLSHLRYEIESQYWTHWELFPNTRDLTPDLVDELRDIALHAAADTITSRTSTALWNTEQNQAILNLINNMNLYSGKRRGYSACVVGRMMRNLTHNQFVHLYGQRGARLDRDQSIHRSVVNPRTLLMTIFSPLLFWAPETHLQSLETIWVDRLVHEDPWSQFTHKLTAEWQEIIIIVIVLLNANVAFLSIQSTNASGNTVKNRSAAQIGSYISIIVSLGSLILSLLLVRQAQGRRTAHDAAKFLGNMTHETRGLETLAILYALPYALLMWSMLAFLVAFMYTCFFSSSTATRFIVGAVLVTVGLLVALCVRTGWTNRNNLWESRGATPASDAAYDVEPQELKASADTLTRCGDAAEDEKPGANHQRIWAAMPFVRKSKSNSRIQIDNNMGQKSEV